MRDPLLPVGRQSGPIRSNAAARRIYARPALTLRGVVSALPPRRRITCLGGHAAAAGPPMTRHASPAGHHLGSTPCTVMWWSAPPTPVPRVITGPGAPACSAERTKCPSASSRPGDGPSAGPRTTTRDEVPVRNAAIVPSTPSRPARTAPGGAGHNLRGLSPPGSAFNEGADHPGRRRWI